MIDEEAITQLAKLASIHDVDAEWHHADACGFSVQLIGETLSNAYPPSAENNESCLVVMHQGPEDHRPREVAVLNVTSLFADAVFMYEKLQKLRRLLNTDTDSLGKNLL
jgi:hypothetical protein